MTPSRQTKIGWKNRGITTNRRKENSENIVPTLNYNVQLYMFGIGRYDCQSHDVLVAKLST